MHKKGFIILLPRVHDDDSVLCYVLAMYPIFGFRYEEVIKP